MGIEKMNSDTFRMDQKIERGKTEGFNPDKRVESNRSEKIVAHQNDVYNPDKRVDNGKEGKVIGRREIGSNIDISLVPDYLKEVQQITHRDIKPVQMEKLQKAMKEQTFSKLDPEKYELNKRLYNSAREKLIVEWENHTGDKWPRYQADVKNDKGEVIRAQGQHYDAHHFFELSYGGPNAWWNLHPAACPNEHQGGIHGANSIANKLFR